MKNTFSPLLRLILSSPSKSITELENSHCSPQRLQNMISRRGSVAENKVVRQHTQCQREIKI